MTSDVGSVRGSVFECGRYPCRHGCRSPDWAPTRLRIPLEVHSPAQSLLRGNHCGASRGPPQDPGAHEWQVCPPGPRAPRPLDGERCACRPPDGPLAGGSDRRQGQVPVLECPRPPVDWTSLLVFADSPVCNVCGVSVSGGSRVGVSPGVVGPVSRPSGEVSLPRRLSWSFRRSFLASYLRSRPSSAA